MEERLLEKESVGRRGQILDPNSLVLQHKNGFRCVDRQLAVSFYRGIGIFGRPCLVSFKDSPLSGAG